MRAQSFNADAQDSADFLEFLGSAGLGQAEAASLTRSDIDFDSGYIITFRHKTSTGFAIPICPQVRPLLERLCENKSNGDPVFKIRDAKKALAGACRRLGFPAFSQRSLRRMFITRAIERGVDVKVIAMAGPQRRREIDLGHIFARKPDPLAAYGPVNGRPRAGGRAAVCNKRDGVTFC